MVRDKKHESGMTNGSLSVLYVLALLGLKSHAIKMEFLWIEFLDRSDLRRGLFMMNCDSWSFVFFLFCSIMVIDWIKRS